MKKPIPRLSDFLRLDQAERQLVEGMTIETRHYRRHEIIHSQGEPAREIFYLADGWAGACVDVAAGSRQMVKIHLPSDLLGTPSIVLDGAAETLIALSPVTIEVIPVSSFAKLFMSSPRHAAAMFLAAQKERVMLMDRLTSVARTNAMQRLAAFLLHVHDRLAIINEEANPLIELPLSQEELADVLGITPVHANRTMAQLDTTGLVERRGRRITIKDLPALRSLGASPDRKYECDPEWQVPVPGTGWRTGRS
jgi:CRP-like cAMP-binding protein